MAARNCYAESLRDCDGDIEREHYFSRSALDALGPGKLLLLEGFPWMTDGETIPLSLEKLKKPMLCARHNRELGEHVDKVGGEFMRALGCAIDGLGGQHELDGPLLERWLLKCTVGAVAAGISQSSDGTVLTMERIPSAWVSFLFGRREPLTSGYGLWLHSSLRFFSTRPGITFAAIVPPTGVIRGSQVVLRGLEFFFVDGATRPELQRTPDDVLHNAMYRPRLLRFLSRATVTDIVLEWPDSGGGEVRIRTPSLANRGLRARSSGRSLHRAGTGRPPTRGSRA